MNLYFWQNIISPHQIDFLKEISKKNQVTLIVEKIQDDYRAKDGWEVPNYNYLKVVVNPSLYSLDEYFEDLSGFHIFSGISAYKLVFEGFRKAVKYNANIGVLSEPINLSGAKGFLKLLRGNYQRIRYGKKIGFIAATGDLGIQTYLKFGYNQKKLFQWGYFVDYKGSALLEKKNQAIFVGQLTNRKQIIQLTQLFKENRGYGYEEFLILGKGDNEPILKELIKGTDSNFKIRLLGRKTSFETIKIISESALLIIPSLFDGWAVVVNEALLAGTPVIASEQVGAKILIENSDRGDVFRVGNMQELNEAIIKWSCKCYTQDNYIKIQNWAFDNILPPVVVDYFREIIDYIFYNKTEQKPIAPWLKNKK